ncbi:MAG TPA: hypothetical protein VMV33_13585 [Rhodocyclaceae bacterium]|nr:hypothetical protein [Rhodocyclaceae bacterium]
MAGVLWLFMFNPDIGIVAYALQHRFGYHRDHLLYVIHDRVEAIGLAQRMIVMNQGHAEQIGAPMAV